MKKRGQNGFTLYELLITVLIVGIVLAIGVPNLGGFARNSRITGTTNDLHGSFMLARSEAARAKENVTICSSANSMDGEPACGAPSFAAGWIIFVDNNGDGDRAAGVESVVKAFPPANDAVLINSSGDRFSFAPSGLGANGAAFIAMICDERGNITAPGGDSAARRVVVTPIGRSTIIRSTQTIADSIAEGGVGCLLGP